MEDQPDDTRLLVESSLPCSMESAPTNQETVKIKTGQLIINADDWGRDQQNTDRILDCVRLGTVSSASGMVFMNDSERAASLAIAYGVDVGLHINLTTPFSGPGVSAELANRQQEIVRYLSWHPSVQTVFHPGLARSFEYVVAAQLDEFCRTYGRKPERVDGHHHMHLCANVLWGGLLPKGIVARRNFSFRRGEKSSINRLYRKLIDLKLAHRNRLADCLFSLAPINPTHRLEQIFSIARHSIVEVETHPVNFDEYEFLTGREIYRCANNIAIASGFKLPIRTPTMRNVAQCDGR
jgi:predicted glycoside hydrolase/deacetylase ChbG (UPF0249 family)